MSRLVAAAVVALGALVAGAWAEVGAASPRQPNQKEYPLPPQPGNKGLDYCNPIVARFQQAMIVDLEGEARDRRQISTTASISTSTGQVAVPIEVSDFRLRNLDQVKRFMAGNLTDNTVECAVNFENLDVFTRYKATINSASRLPKDVAAGYLTYDARVKVEFTVALNPNGVLDELESIEVRRPAVSNFKTPRMNRVSYRSRELFTAVLRDSSESALKRVIHDVTERELNTIIKELTGV